MRTRRYGLPSRSLSHLHSGRSASGSGRPATTAPCVTCGLVSSFRLTSRKGLMRMRERNGMGPPAQQGEGVVGCRGEVDV